MPTFTTYAGAGDTTLTSALLAPANAGISILAGSVALHASGPGAVNFYDGSIAKLGIGAGLLLTSGYAPGLVNDVGWDGQDNSGSTGVDNGDADIDAVVNTVFQTVSYDATTLSFDFQATDPNASSLSFDLVFGSEEYPEWVDQFVDCAVVMVNGVNYALFNHDPNHPLSVVSSNLAAGYFQDNAAGALALQYDGISHVLKIVAPINGGGAVNHIKIGIADTGDHIYDSGIFLANLSAGSIPGSGVVSAPGGGTSGDDTLTGSPKDEYFDLQAGNDTVYAGAGDDIVVAGEGSDTVYGGSGADELEGGGGDDLLDGGADIDTAVFGGNMAAYLVSYDGTTTHLSSAADGSDSLLNVELLKFKDGLYALNAGVLTAVPGVTPPAPNAPGAVAISGVAMAGKTLSAIVVDADGVGSNAVGYQWWVSTDGVAWTATGAGTSTHALAEADVGKQFKVSASYTDAHGTPEAPTSAAVTVAQAKAGIVINPMLIDAPAGASVMDPLTTLVNNAIQLGYTPNEASMAVKTVLGVGAGINLASYDAYAVLSQNPSDATALAFMKIAVQVAMTASVSDPTGMNLTLAVLKAHAAGATLTLTSTTDLASAGVDAASMSVVQGLNKDMADAGSYATVQLVWNDWAGQKDNLKPFLGHIEKISVHINQAPAGLASAELQTQQDTSLAITPAELLAGFADPEGGTLQAIGLALDLGGTLTQNADGGWTFLPTPGFSGPVELSYAVQDAQGAAVPASVMLIVAPAPVPPTPVDHPATGSLVVTGAAAEGGSLLAAMANLVDPDGPVGVAYRWQQNLAGSWTDLAGLSQPTLAIPADQSYVGRQLRVVATSTDAWGGTTVFEGAAQTIANVNDVHTGSVSISGTAQVGQTLTASHTLADADGLGAIAYQWTANGVNLGNPGGNTLVLAAGQAGQTIAVTALYVDAFGTAESATSAATAPVQAAAPADLTLVGTSSADTLTAGAGNDSLSGLAGADKLYALAGNDVLDGGAGVDLLDGGDGSDLYLVATPNDHNKAEFKDSGAIGVDEVRFTATASGTLSLYSGDTGIERVVIGTGTAALADSSGTVALNLNASAAAKALVLVGNAGSNALTGGSGNDTLIGGNGKDTLTGGGGADSFVFDQPANAAGNLDTITDFVHLSDKLQFSAAAFTGLSATGWSADQFWSAAGATSAHDATDRLIYNTSTGSLYYDADGSGSAAAPIQLALIGTGKSHPVLDWTDIVVGA